MAGKVVHFEPKREKPKNTRQRVPKERSFDFMVFYVVILLVLFGIIMIFSSSYYYTLTNAKFNNDMFYFLKRQAIWAVAGIFCMLFFSKFSLKTVRKFSFLVYLASIVFLALLPFIGEDINGSKRWLGIGPIGFQPSEVAKIAIILFLSSYLASNPKLLYNFKGYMKCGIIILIPAALIGIANMSTCVVFLAISMAILFVASPSIKPFVAIGVGAVALGSPLLFLPQFKYRLGRIAIWWNPFSDPTGKGYQIIQSLYAVASGGLFGLGLGQSRQKTFIPEAYNDIIFAIICEELGLVGAAIIIILFIILIWRGIRISMNARDKFSCLTAIGIITMIGIQAVINIAVVTNSMPNTGQPLPFVSYGGSSLLITMSAMGILLNISRYQKNKEIE